MQGAAKTSEARRLFGTDGVRGLANAEPMTPETALRLGRAITHLCARAGAAPRSIIIGKDTRVSGDMLEAALAAGICSMGVKALAAGVLPTPGVAFLTRSMQAAAGAVVSASHNPFSDNGIKFFAASGFKLPDAAEQEIEQWVLDSVLDTFRPTHGDIGRFEEIDDAEERYATFLKGTLPRECRLDGLRIVIDCAHGAAFRVGPRVITALGARAVAMGVDPDGTNINSGCGAAAPQCLQEAVRAQQAHLGIALDGDADRLILVDENGEVVDGDEVLAMMAADMLPRGTLRHATVVATVMSNIGLEIALRERGVRLVRTQVGDRYVVEEMVRHGYNLGGEQSGHLLFLDHSTTGDGLLAALAVVRLLLERQRPLSELKRVMTKFPQTLLNVRVARRQELSSVPPVRETIERIAAELHDRGRVVVRYSGTEPLLRVMVEGEDAARVRAFAEEIGAVIQTHLGA